MERDFKEVAYFYCSPLGRLPDSSAVPFAPKGVLNPLGWLLKGYGLDFENGTSGKAISEAKTVTATPYKPKVTPQGETMNGKAIATLWGFSVIALLFGVVSFTSTVFDGFQFQLMATTPTSSTLVTNTVSNSNSVVSNKTIKSGVYGINTTSSGTYEARILNGTLYSDKIEVRIRQTSKNYSGQWVDWESVIRNSYLTDNLGNRYSTDLSQCYGWNNGYFKKGEFREGTIVFMGNVLTKAKQLTLHFSYIPPQSEIIIQIPLFEKKTKASTRK